MNINYQGLVLELKTTIKCEYIYNKDKGFLSILKFEIITLIFELQQLLDFILNTFLCFNICIGEHKRRQPFASVRVSFSTAFRTTYKLQKIKNRYCKLEISTLKDSNIIMFIFCNLFVAQNAVAEETRTLVNGCLRFFLLQILKHKNVFYIKCVTNIMNVNLSDLN